jgi:phenylpropionate dioxygenase-like ring-hydroxylating dioxygenase large terminal subunit
MSSTHRQLADDVADLVIPPQGEGGYDENWYPVVMSADLAEGEVTTVPFLGDLVTIFRAESGTVQALSPYCAHLGADLGLGEVVGETVQCPFHHWCYGGDGRCVHIPATPTAPIPNGAQVFAYPTAEKWGIVWVYNGETPAYPVPSPLGVDPDGSYYLTNGYREPSNGDPWLHTVNIVDLQHIVYLHGASDFPMTLDTPLDVGRHHVQYEFDLDFMGPAHAKHGLLGSNVVSASIWNKEDNQLVWGWMMAMLAVPGGQSKAFRVGITPKFSDDPGEAAAAEGFFEMMTKSGDKIRDEDEELVTTIRPRPRNLLPGPDDYLRRALAWYRDYPRTDPAEGYR